MKPINAAIGVLRTRGSYRRNVVKAYADICGGSSASLR